MPRPVLIVYGGCQAHEIGRILDGSGNVAMHFEVLVHRVADQPTDSGAWANEAASADYLFVQDIPEATAYQQNCLNRSHARVIRYPFLSLPGLWPFDSAKGVVDPVATALQKTGIGVGFFFQDALMARLRRHIPDPDERFEAYRTLSAPRHPAIAAYFARLDLPAYFAQSLAKLRGQDAAFDLGVGGAIESQIRQLPLFHTVTHPAAALLRRLAGELMGKIGLSLEPQSDVSDGFAAFQVPVHPLVARATGITWAPAGRGWAFHTTQLTFEQYYRQYIAKFG
jgi:hypothetical protein